MNHPLIQFFRVLYAIIRHRLFISPVKDDPKYGDFYKNQVTEFKPAIRTELCEHRNPKKLILARKTFTPPEWIQNSSDRVVETWRDFILTRPENYCEPKIVNPKKKKTLNEGPRLKVA